MRDPAVIHYFFSTLKKNNEACIRLKSLFVMKKKTHSLVKRRKVVVLEDSVTQFQVN